MGRSGFSATRTPGLSESFVSSTSHIFSNSVSGSSLSETVRLSSPSSAGYQVSGSMLSSSTRNGVYVTPMTSVVSSGKVSLTDTSTIVSSLSGKSVERSTEAESVTTIVPTKSSGETSSPFSITISNTVPSTQNEHSSITTTLTSGLYISNTTATAVISTSSSSEQWSLHNTVIVKSLDESSRTTSMLSPVIPSSSLVYNSVTGGETTISGGSSTASIDLDYEGKGANTRSPLALILFSILFLI